MQVGARIDEQGILPREGSIFYLRRDAGSRFRLDLRRTPIDKTGKQVRVIDTYVGDEAVDVDGVSLV